MSARHTRSLPQLYRSIVSTRTSASQFADVAVPVMPATARRTRGPHGHPAYAVKLTTSLK